MAIDQVTATDTKIKQNANQKTSKHQSEHKNEKNTKGKIRRNYAFEHWIARRC